MLEYNSMNNILFFRITSTLIPFASHQICKINWQRRFKDQFRAIGDYIKKFEMRISMHPGQFTIINSLKREVFDNSVRELIYHTQILDLMDLDLSAKIQTHVGGVYGNKSKSERRFIERYSALDDSVKCRLVIENDDKNYGVRDCLEINKELNIPVLLDVFHHDIFNNGEKICHIFKDVVNTWKTDDGLPMVDYSSNSIGNIRVKHAETIDINHFKTFLDETKPFDFDIMLEIKDKEKSALKAVRIALQDDRFKKR